MTGLAPRPVHHLGYAVPDLETAATWFAQTLGAGPFFALGTAEFDELLHAGEPATFEHQPAFGQWGALAIELQQITAATPETVAAALGPNDRGVRLNHMSYLVDDLAAESARLAARGLPELLSARRGPLAIRMHDAPGLGHAIELHEHSPLVDDLFAQVRAASAGWDGRGPLRTLVPA